MSTEAPPLVVDEHVACRLFVFRRSAGGRPEILLIRRTDRRMVLPGASPICGESDTATVSRIAAALGVSINRFETAGRVINERQHPDFPHIAKVLVVLGRDLEGRPDPGDWIALDLLWDRLAPQDWSLIEGALRYLSKERDRTEFLYLYQGVAPASEAAAWRRQLAAIDADPGADPSAWPQLFVLEERMSPAECFLRRIADLLKGRIYA